MKTGRALIILCLLSAFTACGEGDADPHNRPCYQRGYSDGSDDGAARTCKKIRDFSRQVYQDLADRGICN